MPSHHGTSIVGFDHQPRTRLVFGVGTAERAGALVRELGASRVLLVGDPGIVAAGHEATVRRSLESAGLAVTVYDQVHENPTTADVEAALLVARAGGGDAIVGLGGGSAMDTAKGCNFLLTNGGRMHDYRGMGKATRPMLPMVAIPTTAGTGSECQSFAIIADAVTHQKMACGDPRAAARVALLDPMLTLTQPSRVTAHTGIDAIAHAVEAAVTLHRHEWSLMYAHEALRHVARGFPRVLSEPGNIEARADMQLGAAWAGMAIEASMLGAAHAAANPLTARHGVVHGAAVGVMLPGVVRYNAHDAAAARDYARAAVAAGLADRDDAPSIAVDRLVRWIESMLAAAGIPRTLAPMGVAATDIPLLAEDAAGQWTAGHNPRPIDAAGFARLYAELLSEAPRT